MITRLIALLTMLYAVLMINLANAQSSSLDDHAGPGPISVRAQKMREVLVHPTRRISADVLSLNHALISAQAGGEVLGVEVRVGDAVEKGATMVRIDCRLPQLNLAASIDEVNLTRKEYKRALALQKSRTIAVQQFNQTHSTFEQAKIRMNQAELAVEHCLIVAPFAGVITARSVQLGANIAPGEPIVKLLQANAVEVVANLSEAELGDIKGADQIYFDDKAKAYALVLRAVVPLVDNISNKQLVRFSFSDQTPLPGVAGNLSWKSASSVMPTKVIQEREGVFGYFIADEGQARFIALPNARLGHPTLIEDNGNNIAVIKIIVKGQHQLVDGSEIVLEEQQ